MIVRDFRPGVNEQWSEHFQTLRHAGEKSPEDDRALLHDPDDYSGVGGPDDERIYGHNRSDDGHYPWNANGGAYDANARATQRVAASQSGPHRPKEWDTFAPHHSEPDVQRARIRQRRRNGEVWMTVLRGATSQ